MMSDAAGILPQLAGGGGPAEGWWRGVPRLPLHHRLSAAVPLPEASSGRM